LDFNWREIITSVLSIVAIIVAVWAAYLSREANKLNRDANSISNEANTLQNQQIAIAKNIASTQSAIEATNIFFGSKQSNLESTQAYLSNYQVVLQSTQVANDATQAALELMQSYPRIKIFEPTPINLSVGKINHEVDIQSQTEYITGIGTIMLTLQNVGGSPTSLINVGWINDSSFNPDLGLHIISARSITSVDSNLPVDIPDKTGRKIILNVEASIPLNEKISDQSEYEMGLIWEKELESAKTKLKLDLVGIDSIYIPIKISLFKPDIQPTRTPLPVTLQPGVVLAPTEHITTPPSKAIPTGTLFSLDDLSKTLAAPTTPSLIHAEKADYQVLIIVVVFLLIIDVIILCFVLARRYHRL